MIRVKQFQCGSSPGPPHCKTTNRHGFKPTNFYIICTTYILIQTRCTTIMRHTYEILLGSYRLIKYNTYICRYCVVLYIPCIPEWFININQLFFVSGVNQRPRRRQYIRVRHTCIFFLMFLSYILVVLFLTNLNSSSDTFALADRTAGSAM